MNQLGERCMALDKHAGIERKSKRFRELRYSCAFVETTAIGEEDERNAMLLQEA